MKLYTHLLRLLLPILLLSGVISCTNDPEVNSDDIYGYVQFRVEKTATRTLSRADGADRLDSLSDARKIKVTLRSGDAAIEQTMLLTAASDSLGEYGLRSEKLKLRVDDYTLLGYELYDNTDGRILSGEPAEQIVMHIIPGGLTVQSVGVNVIPRGLATFSLVGDFSQLQTRADAPADYMLGNVKKADIKVRNTASGEVVIIGGVRTSMDYYYDEQNPGYLTSRALCDTIVPLKAGTYRVTSYTVYDKNDRMLELNTAVVENEFTVADNRTTEAQVPVTMRKTAGHIMDGIVLKQIWEALDGPNWSYRGTTYTRGSNWNFNRDEDLWTAQPGVEVLENGRVASISLGGFGAKGDIPEVLGDLTELRALYVGTHLDESTDSPIRSIEEMFRTGGAEALHKYMMEYTIGMDGLMAFPVEMRMTFTEEQQERLKELDRRKAAAEKQTRANDPHNYSNAVTSLPHRIGELEKLETLYISDGLISELPAEVANLKKCTTVELFNCRRMTKFPKALAQMPAVVSLNMSFNSELSGEELYEGLKLMNESPIAKTLQGLFLISDRLEKLPDMRGMERLRSLNCTSNKIHTIEAPFGKDHPFSSLLLSNNKLSSLPIDGDGYFVGFDSNVETLSFSYNEFTQLPDIFDSKSIFGLGTVDFSFNKISTIEHAAEGTYKGIRAEIFNLAYNKLPEFPKCIYNSGSNITFLSVAGNGMKGFEKDAFKGEWIENTTTLDFSGNCFTELPKDFNNRQFPYVQAMDMSYNSFAAYPWQAMNLSNLRTFIFRGQRDANGFRCMKEWPKGIGAHPSLLALLLGSNDIRKVNDTISYDIYNLDITDNPNIVIDLTNICPYIKARYFNLMYDPTQDIRGCDILNLKK